MMTHDYEMVESALSEWLNAKSPPFSDAAKIVWLNSETIRHALSEMARMQKENLVMVPIEVIEDTLHYVGKECYFDHHGYCQAHGLQEKEDCFAGKLNTALSAAPTPPVTGSAWTKELPTEQAWYWWWNEHTDDAPVPISVMYSGTSKKCFVATGQMGIKQAMDCDKFGGMWMRIDEPAQPESGA